MNDTDRADLAAEMTRAVREQHGDGFVDDYYEQLAQDFVEVAEWFIDSRAGADPKDFAFVGADDAEEWSAIYRDGKLVDVGDTCLMQEKLLSLLGVSDLVFVSMFLGRSGTAENVADTLDEMTAYQQGEDKRRIEQRRLREAARRLLAEADAMNPP